MHDAPSHWLHANSISEFIWTSPFLACTNSLRTPYLLMAGAVIGVHSNTLIDGFD
jgi:hypothetical protein